ncbi:MAG: hypothetical protein U1A53_15695, partial [Prosthecobacter sp.]
LSAFCFLLSAFCFLLSAFCFLLSAFCFLLSAFCFLLFFRPVDHGGHDGDEFAGLLFDGLSLHRRDAAVFAQQFQPELGFIRLLESTPEL